MDRLSHSLLDFAQIMDVAQRQGWSLIALDCPVDPSTPTGEAMASIVATFAQLERRLIGQRPREALAAKEAAGVQLGRPRELPEDVVQTILGRRAEGSSLRAIAASLTRRRFHGTRRGAVARLHRARRDGVGEGVSPFPQAGTPRLDNSTN